MKNVYLFLALFALPTLFVNGAEHTISNSGTTFSPSDITINAGDVIVFSLGNTHNAVEVTKETYDANGNTPKDGGFSVGFGGGSVTFTNVGTYYYVCEPHASLGMKGVIRVVSGTTATQDVSTPQDINIYPNPVTDRISIGFTLAHQSNVSIKLVNVAGAAAMVLLDEMMDAGYQTFGVDLSSRVAPGIYFVSIVFDEGEFVKKIIVQ
jgi:plastocyanin